MPAVEVFRALGDPTRLEMVNRLSSGSSYTITTVSSGLGVSRQAARKHLQVLIDAHLVTPYPEGRDTRLELEAASLETAKQFIALVEQRWDKRLQALRDFVED